MNLFCVYFLVMVVLEQEAYQQTALYTLMWNSNLLVRQVNPAEKLYIRIFSQTLF